MSNEEPVAELEGLGHSFPPDLPTSEERYRNIIEAIEHGYYEVNIRGDTTFFNNSYCEIMGRPREELQGINYRNYMDEPTAKKTYEVFNGVYRTGKAIKVYDYEIIRKDGTRRTCSISVSLMKNDKGQPCGFRGILRDVTDLKSAEKALRGIQERLDLAVKGADLGLWDYNVQTGEAFINARRAEMVGYALEEAEPHITWWGKQVHPEDLHKVRKAFNNHVKGRTPFYECEHRLRHKSGEYIWVLSRGRITEWDEQGNPVRLVGTSLDITDRKRAEEALQLAHNELERRVEERTAELRETNEQLISEIAERKQAEELLRESEEKYRTIFEKSPAGLIRFGPNGIVTECNEAFVLLVAAPREQVVGFNLLTSIRNQDVRDAAEAALSGKTGQFEGEYTSVTGSKTVWASIVYAPLTNIKGEVLGGIGIVQDLTMRKQAEDALVRAERLTAIADLAGGVAHNFNNLLQIVMGGIDLALIDLEMGNVSELKKTLEQVLESSKFGAETVRRLQSFAQVRAEVQAPEGEVFDLSEIVHQATEMTKPLWKTGPDKEGRSISLSTSLTDGCFVNGKESEVFEVLVNLIKNAAEALPRGGEIRIKTFVQGDAVMLQVIDTGVGISRKNFKRVFEPFWSTKGVSAGTGMGLAVSHGIILRHKGSISIESEEGKGTTFTVRLTLAKEPEETGQPLGEEILRLKLNVLVIDDMVPIIMLVEMILTKHEQTVFSSTSGEEALEIFRNNQIDLVICDLGMPGMTGWEVGKVIRMICQERGIPKTPFILLTGWGGQALEKEKIIESGVDAVEEKPLDSKKLMATVREVVERVFPQESK